MRLRHFLPTTSCRSEGSGERAIFLRNQTGDFLAAYTSAQTRYGGWFRSLGNDSFLKLLETVEILENDAVQAVTSVTSMGHTAFWEFQNGVRLGWKMAGAHSGLALSFSQAARVRIVLDIRRMYGQPAMGRNYAFTSEADGVVVSYQDGELPEAVYLHIRCRQPLVIHDRWREQAYPRDAARHSEPSRLFVMEAAETDTDFLSFGAGTTIAEAKEASLAASRQKAQPPTVGINYTHDTLLNQVTTAKATAGQALRWLQTERGMYAGLPWFHQVWSRDELIAALGLTADLQHEIIDRYIGLPLQEGELPTYQGSGTTCADGVGWLCLLIKEYGPLHLKKETRERLVPFLQAARSGLIASRQAGHGLIRSGHNATWMDTIGREGYRIEIQCMYALLLELLFALTADPAYEQERLRHLGRIKQFFWLTDYLKDGMDDATIRPNLFLAYLLQPDLLSAHSWYLCFDTALEALSCPWGGLSSLERSHPDFHPRTTGEDNQSYHNGDSWFFINNLAAMAMRRLNGRRYSKPVLDILQSSTSEILWEHMLGQPGEISSAAEMESYGCGIQAFSGGTYLALLRDFESYGEQDLESSSFWEATAF